MNRTVKRTVKVFLGITAAVAAIGALGLLLRGLLLSDSVAVKSALYVLAVLMPTLFGLLAFLAWKRGKQSHQPAVPNPPSPPPSPNTQPAPGANPSTPSAPTAQARPGATTPATAGKPKKSFLVRVAIFFGWFFIVGLVLQLGFLILAMFTGTAWLEEPDAAQTKKIFCAFFEPYGATNFPYKDTGVWMPVTSFRDEDGQMDFNVQVDLMFYGRQKKIYTWNKDRSLRGKWRQTGLEYCGEFYLVPDPDGKGGYIGTETVLNDKKVPPTLEMPLKISYLPVH